MAKRILIAILVLVFSLATFFLGSIYFKRKDMLYENGRYFDSDHAIVYHEQSVSVYLTLFLIALSTALLLSVYLVRLKKTNIPKV